MTKAGSLEVLITICELAIMTKCSYFCRHLISYFFVLYKKIIKCLYSPCGIFILRQKLKLKMTYFRGWFVASAVIQATFKEDPLLKKLKTRHGNWFSLQQTWMLMRKSKMVLITYASYAIRSGTVSSLAHIEAVSVRELMSPML